jgi:hypothetical protein
MASLTHIGGRTQRSTGGPFRRSRRADGKRTLVVARGYSRKVLQWNRIHT